MSLLDEPSPFKGRKRRRKNGHANGGTVAAAADDWRALLLTNLHGSPKALLANAVLALRLAPEWSGLLYFDAFRQRTMLRGRPPWLMSFESERIWTDVDDIHTADWLQHRGIAVHPRVAREAVELVARERLVHPVLDYLASCRWDGESRLDTWATRYLSTEDTIYTSAVGARFLIQAVARVQKPGCKADCALILEGKQGLLKSTALQTLAEPWFTDEIADLGSKDAAMQVAGAWIIEMAELDSMRRSEVSRIKAFLSRTTDRYRPPYGSRLVEQPRQCVFAGTANDNQYLRDPTGGRRFWPLACGRIDIGGLAAVKDQLWAEARDRYEAGESWWLDDPEVAAAATEEQAARYVRDPWHDLIARQVIGLSAISVAEVLNHLQLPEAERTQLHENRVAMCLKALGWERKQVRTGRGRTWVYVPPGGQNGE